MYNSRDIGSFGEQLAIQYLVKNEYTILEKNFRNRIGEIDIIVKKDGIIIFVEVKSRRSLRFGQPFEAVDYRKAQKIIKVAQSYINYKNISNIQYRFDIIEVFLNQKYKINHIKDAFWL